MARAAQRMVARAPLRVGRDGGRGRAGVQRLVDGVRSRLRIHALLGIAPAGERGASCLLRLADGVVRRALLLRQRRPELAALAAAAESTATTAHAGDDDPALAQRLLELAASLDDALAPEAA